MRGGVTSLVPTVFELTIMLTIIFTHHQTGLQLQLKISCVFFPLSFEVGTLHLYHLHLFSASSGLCVCVWLSVGV